MQLERHVRLPVERALPKNVPAKAPDSGESAVAFVFSGGVFRGVFQVGFANAVAELNLRPDVIVGASVGTIMGGLIGKVLDPSELAERRYHSQRLTATFLAIDQFVMTDRCADFVRRFSIRAAGADFSLRDADRAFRRYDEDGARTFGRRLRRVVAGLERIFYLSPFELRDFVETARLQNYQSLWAQFKEHVQEWFDRYGVGLELLGPEPLELLINGILYDDDPEKARDARFADATRSFDFLGTTTNLTQGRLDILGMGKLSPRLTEGLLASSAFPAVFRPRWSWEVFENPTEVAQYADGGIMDNIPLDSVVNYLAHGIGDGGPRFPRRPEVPHLIVAASLEPEPEDWSKKNPREIEARCGSWLDLSTRAGELAYNGKIDDFANAQTHFRRILRQRKEDRAPLPPDAALPLNLEVAVVKAQWLCSTFAFHPMLGFRRADQAASIAHGCAATFQTLAQLFFPKRKSSEKEGAFREREMAAEKRRAWADKKPDGKRIAYAQLAGGGVRRDLDEDQQAAGVCWFRTGADGEDGPLCPYAAAVVRTRAGDDSGPGEAARRETLALQLNAIYITCGQTKTHTRDRKEPKDKHTGSVI